MESSTMSAGPEVAREISDDVIKRLLPSEIFDLLSDSISGEVLPEYVSEGLFDRVLKVGNFYPRARWFIRESKLLRDLRGSRGETLWESWAEGWQTSTEIADLEARERVQGALKRIAEKLKKHGVDVNEPGDFETPLTSMAARGATAAGRDRESAGMR